LNRFKRCFSCDAYRFIAASTYALSTVNCPLRALGLQTLLRELRKSPTKQLTVRFETAPGAQAQMDWASYEMNFTIEGKRRVHLFSYILGYSRRQYIHFTESMDFETTIRQHIKAFDHLGGVAAVCLYDNMRVVVTRWEDDSPVYNTRFLAFATHYGYKPWACKVRRPQPNKPPATKRSTARVTEQTLRQSILRHLQTLKIRISEEELDSVVRESTEHNYSSWQLLERFLAAPAIAGSLLSLVRSVDHRRIRVRQARAAGVPGVTELALQSRRCPQWTRFDRVRDERGLQRLE